VYINSLVHFNKGLLVTKKRKRKTLLGKWLWQFANEKNAFWRKVVDRKYGCGCGGWCSKEGRGGYGVSLWKYIQSGWLRFTRCITYSTRSRDAVRFSLD
jgi:hypothetical protein